MMKRKKKQKMIPAVTLLMLLTAPILASAQISFTVESFIGIKSVEELLSALLNIFIVIATPIVILFIIYAGFLYVTARGNAQQIEQATKAFTYAVIGGVIILGAVALGEVIKNIVEAFKRP